MSDKLRVGLMLRQSDIEWFRRTNPDVLLLPPGVALSEEKIAADIGCEVINLNRFMDRGAITAASRKIAPIIRGFLETKQPLPIEAKASQNDLYQYHLRMQFYFLTALETALTRLNVGEVLIATAAYPHYWSPMRPARGTFHDPAKVDAFLAHELVQRLGIESRHIGSKTVTSGRLKLALSKLSRRLLINAFRWKTLIVKCVRASRDHTTPSIKLADNVRKPIGFVLRTDSEVVAASYIWKEFERRDIPFVIFQDEMLSSQTTANRLRSLDMSYVSIGSAFGLSGLVKAWRTFPRRLTGDSMLTISDQDEAAATQVIKSNEIWHEMGKRCLDFAPDQKHFHIEFSELVSRYQCSAIIAFAYVDQWGPVIADVAAQSNIPCIAIQNAAQDPEEYPRLCWASHYCVESVYLKSRLIEMGYPKDRLTGTGLPQLTGASPETNLSSSSREGFKTITVLTQPLFSEYFIKIIKVAGEIAAREDWQLIIKYHPRQSLNDYRDCIAEVKKKISVVKEQTTPLEEILERSTVVVSVVSAAIINAISAGVPVFSLLPVEEKHVELTYVDHPVTRVCDSDYALMKELSDFIRNFGSCYASFVEHRQDFFASYATPEKEDRSVYSIVDLIENEISCASVS